MNEQIINKFRPVFYPDSIAVVGASKDLVKSGARYFANLVKAGFKGRLYPVNRDEDNILGFKAYSGICAIPGPVEYVIVAVPVQYAFDILNDCVKKKVKTVQLFTAGFRELGTPEGLQREEAITRVARENGINIIGPNCIGICNPSSDIPFGPIGIAGKPGNFGFISQSGGHGGGVYSSAIARGIGFSKAVSFGNGCDLDSPDFLEYLGIDENTRIIGAYLEGIKDGKRLYKLIKEISKHKPVLIWKGGKTAVGAVAAASHTGSMATPYAVWSSAMSQAGAINIDNMDEFIDTILAFYYIKNFKGTRSAIISGLVDGGGGDSVSATDACVSIGIEVPQFAAETRKKLTAILRSVGIISHNPLDIGAPGANFPVIVKAVEIVADDPNIDVIIIQKHVDILLNLLDRETVYKMNDLFIELSKKAAKPVVLISPSAGMAEVERVALDGKLAEAGVPVYPGLERAARALSNMGKYYKFRN